MAISPKEITVGLVLHLDAATMTANGATCTCETSRQVKGGHFFLCTARTDGASRWVPLYTKPGPGRTRLASDARTGHDKFTKGTFHWHKDQIWTADDPTIVAAARAGGDRSTTRSRNRLDPAHVPKL